MEKKEKFIWAENQKDIFLQYGFNGIQCFESKHMCIDKLYKSIKD